VVYIIHICLKKILKQHIFYIPLFFFFFTDTATPEIYTVGNTLSLHDALPISQALPGQGVRAGLQQHPRFGHLRSEEHTSELQSLPTISYAVFCLKKKNRMVAVVEAFTGFGLIRKHKWLASR